LDPRPKVTAFGDSVLLGASRALEQTFNVDLYARVAEQAADLGRVISTQAANGGVRDTVVVHVGNNGIITEEQLRGMLGALSGAERVVLVTVRVPRPWMDPNNALFERVAADYRNVTLADWAAESAEHRDFMVSDGVHLTSKGAAAYTRLIAESAGVEVPE
jgi:lysophospholipase L1-like esterase